jgi:hypothetical protein
MKEENMKQKTFNKKMVINKVTIVNLTHKEQISVRGGATIQGRDCDGTIQGPTCDQEFEAKGTIQGPTCDQGAGIPVKGTIQGRTCDELP